MQISTAQLASWCTLVGLMVAASGTWTACASTKDRSDTVSVSPDLFGSDEPRLREEVIGDILAHTGPYVVEPAVGVFVTEARLLHAAVRTWSLDRDDMSRAAAQDQWRVTMLAWQYLEGMQFGPAGSEYLAGGHGLRDEIYSWPWSSSCRVDQVLVYADWSESSFFEDPPPYSAYGLDAIEYLLFESSTENTCPDSVDINADGTWDALGDEAIARARAEMATVLVENVVEVGTELYEGWSDGFSASLAGGSDAQSVEALNTMFYAMRYMESYVLIGKLCHPLGLSGCPDEPISPDDFEHIRSMISTEAVHSNLLGFRDLFTGRSGAGLDDLLVWSGYGSLADDFLMELDEAIGLAAGPDFTSDDARVLELYEEVQDVTVLLFGDIATVLTLRNPSGLPMGG